METKSNLIDPAIADGLVPGIVQSLSADSRYTLGELGIDLAALLRSALRQVSRERYEEFILRRPLPCFTPGFYGADPAMRGPLEKLAMPKTHAELADIAKQPGLRARPGFPRVPIEEVCPTFWDQVAQRCRLLTPSQAKWLRDRLAGMANGSISELGTMPPEEPPAPSREEVLAAAQRGAAERHAQRRKLNCSVCGVFLPWGTGICDSCKEATATATSV